MIVNSISSDNGLSTGSSTLDCVRMKSLHRAISCWSFVVFSGRHVALRFDHSSSDEEVGRWISLYFWSLISKIFLSCSSFSSSSSSSSTIGASCVALITALHTLILSRCRRTLLVKTYLPVIVETLVLSPPRGRRLLPPGSEEAEHRNRVRILSVSDGNNYRERIGDRLCDPHFSHHPRISLWIAFFLDISPV